MFGAYFVVVWKRLKLFRIVILRLFTYSNYINILLLIVIVIVFDDHSQSLSLVSIINNHYDYHYDYIIMLYW